MIYIVCGADCSGKSTLNIELARCTGYSIIKGSSFHIASEGQEEMFNHMMKLLNKDNIVIDRFFFSNAVYGNLFDYPLMSDEQFDLLNRKLNEVADKICLIYLYADKEIIKERLKNRGDEHINESNVESILDLYGKVMHKYRIPEQRTIRLDTGKIEFDNMPNVATTIVNYANRLSEMPERRNY